MYVGVYLKPFYAHTHKHTREDRLVLVHTWSILQLMKINLRIRWSNLTPLGSGARGEKYFTNGQFSMWSARVKKVCKKKKKKLAQIKLQKYLSSLNKELSETAAEGEVWSQALQVGSSGGFCTLFFSGFDDLDRDCKILDWQVSLRCACDWRKAGSGWMGQVWTMNWFLCLFQLTVLEKF